MRNVICGGVEGQAGGDEDFNRDRENSELAALEGLTLEELAAIAAQEIGEGRQLQAEAIGLSRRSTVTFYRAGRALWCARKKLKGKGKRAWTRWQKSHSIPVTSAWQAIRLYEEAEGEEAVAELTRTQALRKYGITKPNKDRVQPPSVEVDQTTANQDAEVTKADGTTNVGNTPPEAPDFRLVPERDGEAGDTDADQDGTEETQDEGEETQAGPTTPPATEILVHIVRRLEILEQDSRGSDLGGEAHSLIDQAIATLRRLRGDAAPEAEAA